MITLLPHGFQISHKGVIILTHTNDTPAIFTGQKNLSITMDKGEFSIDDATHYIPAQFIQVHNDEIQFERFSMTHQVIDNRLHLIINEADCPLRFQLHATKNESIHGLGEHFTSFNLRNHVVKNWVEEHITRPQIYNKIIRRILKLPPKRWPFEDYKTYMIVPAFVSSQHYFCDVDTDGYGTFDFTNDDYHQLSFAHPIKRIVISQQSSLIQTCADLATYKGITPPLPQWVYDGVILGIQGGTEVIQTELQKLLDAKAAINALWVQDWCGELFTYFGKQVLWNWTSDVSLYPQLQTSIQQWRTQGIRFLGYVNPYLNQNESFFKDAVSHGYLVTNPDGTPFLTQATSFQFGIVDFTNPKAYKWYKQLIKEEMLDIGMSGWMADFGEYLPTNCVLYQGNGEESHNTWPDLWTKLNRELLEETSLIGDALFFNRAGYKNNMAYTTLIWNGDQHVDFTDDFGMRSAVRAMLGLSMSGFGLSHSDIGGYTTVPGIKRSKKVYLRWLEMNAFTPVMRSHEGNRPWSNIQPYSDEEIITITARFSRIHKSLKPYFIAIEKEYQDTGTPMIRPLCFYSNDMRDDCFLVGEDLIVFPVFHPRKNKLTLTLPQGKWIHIFTHKEYETGSHKIISPLGSPAVLYRANSSFSSLFNDVHQQ